MMDSTEGITGPPMGEAGYRTLSLQPMISHCALVVGQLRSPSVTIRGGHHIYGVSSSSWGNMSLKEWAGELMLTFFFLSLKYLQVLSFWNPENSLDYTSSSVGY